MMWCHAQRETCLQIGKREFVQVLCLLEVFRAEDLLVGDWDRPYPRELGAYPVPSLRRDKYWPPVGRIDGGYGDRNLFCSFPPTGE